ncbi:hypothetical protein ACFHYQ_24850 [Sphaerimonospora cavernae]|uniref:DUF3558 domain-containing protein n=1 Tax=Sphaerimonospora cavernae TaxID=1740611 RepID=A0ABV6UBE7_9ACTN
MATSGGVRGAGRRSPYRLRLRRGVLLTGVLLLAALSLGVVAPPPVAPGLVTVPTPRLGVDGCPVELLDGRGFTDLPGPLVPDGGAVSVTLCELIKKWPAQGGQPSPPAPGEPRTLTTRVSEMVALINALPTREEEADRIRTRGTARALPADFGFVCTDVGYGQEFSFAVRYADGSSALVVLDRNCGTARSAGRTRFMHGTEPIDAFLGFYREQLLATGKATGKTVATPACAAGLTVREADDRELPELPRDDAARNRGGSDGDYLPSPLAAVTACRYQRHGDRLHLRGRWTTRAGLEPIRDLLNAATRYETVTDENGGITDISHSRCGIAGSTSAQIRRMDVVWVADLTGAVVEIRVWRSPCQAVFRGPGGMVPKPALLARLDTWLGGRPTAGGGERGVR